MNAKAALASVSTSPNESAWHATKRGLTEPFSVGSSYRVNDFSGRVSAWLRASEEISHQEGLPYRGSELSNDTPKPTAAVVIQKIPDILSPTYVALQEWEGVVYEIKGDYLLASLRDISQGEELMSFWAEIPLDELPDDDRTRVKAGTIFRWALGYRREAGVIERFSRIIVRHLPAWTKADLREAEAFADTYETLFASEGDDEAEYSSSAG